MKKKLCMVAMLAVLMSWGCSPDDKRGEAPVSETLPAAELAMEQAVEATEAAEEKLEETTREAAAEIKAVDEVVEEKVTETITAAKAVEEAVEESLEVKAEQQAAVAVEEEKVEAAVKVEEKAVSVVEEIGQALTTAVETIVIDNKNGKVVLLHKKHAEAFGCAACHGDQEPAGPFELGKDKAHAMCLDCHKEQQAGPTSCAQCHQKKQRGAIEGC